MTGKKKKSFYIDEDLCKKWDNFHQSKQDYSVSAAAAMVLWLSLEDMPGLREQLRKIGQGPITAATLRKARELIQDEMVTQTILEEIKDLGPEKTEFLRLLKQAKEQVGKE
jgi:hypothetical protein